MARKNRIEFPGAFYHVLAKGNNKQMIFKDEQDYKIYITRLKIYREQYKFILYAYTLMHNHIHLLIETGVIPLSKIMQGIQQSYTSYFHKKYKSVGHIFQARYKAILCERDAYLLELVRYIHLNAVRAGLVTNPEDYLWSSHRAYLGYLRQSFIEKDFIFNILSDNKYAAEKIYKQFIKDGLEKDRQKIFYDVIDQRILGRSGFIEKIKQRIENQDRKKDQKRKHYIQEQQDLVLNKKKTLSELLEAVTRIMRVSSESILSKSREQQISDARSLYAFVAVRKVGISNKTLAEFLGREISSITKMVRKIEGNLEKDSILADNLHRIIQVIQA